MATEIKVEIIERQTVKPPSPTPHHLRNYELSFLDQMATAAYIPLLLFYPDGTSSTASANTAMVINDRCQHLIESLAKTLTHFYPLAGRIKGNTVIECNDDGAEFVTARVKCSLSEILEHPDAEMLRRLLSVEPESKEAATGTLLVVQVNLFECGGLAIGLSISHKFADATTVGTFITCWSATAHDQSLLTLPQYGSPSLFSPFSGPQPSAIEVEVVREKCITRRFVFDASRIAALQSEVASSVVLKPTRVEAVSALIWKCKIEASSRSSSSNKLGTRVIRPSVFSHTVNMRKRAVPPVSENLAGNLVDFSTTDYSHSREGTSVIDLKDLVAKIRGAIDDLKESYATKVVLDPKEAWQKMKGYMNLMKNDGIDKFICSSWCRLPFYEANFGWGKPSWVSYVSVANNNVTVLMDKRDCNGIEAWVTLSEESMALFESNTDLLAYVSPNPRVTN